MAEQNGGVNLISSTTQSPKQTMGVPSVARSRGPTSEKRSVSPSPYYISRKRLKTNGGSPSSQTPLSILNEMRSGLVYKIVCVDGPPHRPNYLASVEVDGVVYSGSANAKKMAKQKAAEAALLTLCPYLLTPPYEPPVEDFTKDATVPRPSTLNACSMKKSKFESLIGRAMKGAINPVMALNEIVPGLKFECVREESHKSVSPFVFGVKIDNVVYEGSGSSKKHAKAAAARAVLLQKFGDMCNSVLAPPFCATFQASRVSTLTPVAANQIAELVHHHYSATMTQCPEFSRRKVLAGIVMTDTPDCTGGTIISMSTGTKCISGGHISVAGAVLNDSHAEIIARRGLVRFLYNQLLLHTKPETAEKSIFVRNLIGSGFKLKENIRFHLYISTSPCGDARIFSPHDVDLTNEEGVDRHPNRQSRGQLRTKIESGEGTIPVKSSDAIQTWDGVMQGERLLTMSCSDKVAKWNVVGLQGSLLSHFIEPVYLHSIVIGSLFHPSHLRRAIYGRIENTLSGLPPPFRLNKLLMSATSSPESRQIGKAPTHCINWIKDEEIVEVINTSSGKCHSGPVSRLCKQKLFAKFHELLRSGLPSKTGISSNPAMVYVDAKQAMTQYKDAIATLNKAFDKAGLGKWMKKPVEQDQFSLDLSL